MARVASCPQCTHELLVPDEADSEAWAKCPDCKAFFQLKQATIRDVPALLLVDSDQPEVDAQTAPTVADFSSLATWSDPANDQFETPQPAELEPATRNEQSQSSDDRDAAAQRIDEWFRSAKTVPDVSPVEADDAPRSSDEAENDLLSESPAQSGATIDLGAAGLDDFGSSADFELEDAAGPPQSPAAWDDSHHMDRLFADIEGPPVHELSGADKLSLEPDDDADREQSNSALPTDFSPELVTLQRAARRRKRSPLRTFVMIALSGVVGLALGYYALLWIWGPRGDLFQIAQHLPSTILPASLQPEPRQIAANPPASTPAKVEETESRESAADAPPDAVADSAEVQAGYTTTDELAAAIPQTDADRYAIGADDTESAPAEPAQLETPPAAAVSSDRITNEPVRIAGAPSFTADDLRAALELAKKAQPALAAGRLADGKEIQRAKGYSYSMLADLAQTATFVEAAAQSNESQPLQQATQELFRQTLSDAHTRGEVAKILPKWIGSPNRKHGGVFFAGNVASQEIKGSVVECSMELEDGQTITVLAMPVLAEPPLDSARPLAIVGWIVDRPAEKVSGYTGNAPQAIWAGELLPLE